MRKYEFTTGDEKQFDGRTLRRIRAVRDFGRVKAGDLGGWIESERNLSHNGDAWVDDRAQVCADALVCGNAQVYDDARVHGCAQVRDESRVHDNAQVYGEAQVRSNAQVYGDSCVHGEARVYGNAQVYGDAHVHGVAWVYGNSQVYENAHIFTPNHIISIDNIGSLNDTTTFFHTNNDDIYVVCGWFEGDLQAFLQKVEQVHGNNRHGMVYRLAAELARTQIGGE